VLPHIHGEARAAADPDFRVSAGGKGWLILRVVASDRTRGENGSWVDGPAMFIDLIAFGALAEKTANNIKKGDLLVFNGKLSPNDYEKDGNKVVSYRIVAESIGLSVHSRNFESQQETSVSADTEPPF
jgi:single-stranded DNA-binding protein